MAARHRTSRRIDYPRRGRQGLRRWLPSWKLLLGLTLLGTGLLVTAFFVALSVVKIPQPNELAVQQATIFEYADGRTQISHVGMNRRSVPITDIPQVVRNAVLAAEDRGFYSEPGVSPLGLIRALKNNLTGSGGSLQGGSTITQQYVKNYYLSQQQTLSRKFEELLVSIKISNELPKDTILQNYLNTIFFARGAYGIEAAARAYFGVGVNQLANEPAKAAYLAAVIQSPYYYATADKDPEAAQALHKRWDYVVDGMVEQGQLTAQQRAQLVYPNPVQYQADDMGGMNGYMVDAAMGNLDRLHKEDPSVPDSTTVAQGGYTVVTTFRPEVMRAAQKAAGDSLSTLDPNKAADKNVHIGVAAVDDATGEVLGFYGGPDYLKQGFNDALQGSGPLGKVGDLLLKAVPPDHLADLGIDNIDSTHRMKLDGEVLATTPLRAAAALSSLRNLGDYHEPHSVAKVIRDGQVVWQADTRTTHLRGSEPLMERSSDIGFAPAALGTDIPKQWAWSLFDNGHMSVAVTMFATPPDGKGNRAMLGMTDPDPAIRTWNVLSGVVRSAGTG
ncbi:transglycosylase domain-containing protein [Kutzneria albida]|uniref:Glycosyl transferase family 51 domain-containing protein n=1 Tax=Kutzneria albida DSM 43870 TaxID=1449976 RepID=W5WQT5_9PSEU|nr:transglycosylase domain-containing protein [Kutzneria albida]AHI00545.1 hypothetical protein KALB_7187 [Kutzneria albida DSM 43870]